ncbi:MAG TPA: YfiR/HmsC family protein [Tenuifilaceae bacterium]|nr:YfiR/HmsC family protein [Tenuifilaceae bacterium]HPJ44478.1 YfiR/HmsC family protein [Tenuifilaceae bacterium]HRX67947.1 YfiR/HmsC family protein [Tenuifilaceae bacterium]
MKYFFGCSGKMAKVFVLVFFLLTLQVVHAQVVESRIKVALIYNFAQNVEWPNERNISEFRIGVLCSDTTIMPEFRQLSQLNKIKNRSIKVFRVGSPNEVENIQLLYVDEGMSMDISSINKLITGKGILLISDRSPDKLFVMINILFDSKNRTLSYEINRQNMENEGFVPKPEILVHGGSYVDIKQLYIQTYQKLKDETDRINHYQEQLVRIKAEKDSFQVQLNTLNSQISSLLEVKAKIERDFEKQTKNLSEKDSLLLLATRELNRKGAESLSLQKKIKQQLAQIDSTENNLSKLNAEIEKKQIDLNVTQRQLAESSKELSEKQSVIEVQNKYILVSYALAFTLLVTLFLIYRAFRTKKLMNIKLERLVNERTNELHLSREHFKNLFESSPVAIIETDLSRFYSFVNSINAGIPEILEMIKKNKSIVGQSVRQIIVNDINSATLNLFKYDSKKEFIDNFYKTYSASSLLDFQETIVDFINKKTQHRYETTRLTSQGEVIHVQLNWMVLPGYVSNYGRVIVTMTDITELKKHREHLEELVTERSEQIIKLNKKLTETVKELESTVEQLQKAQSQLLISEKMASLGMLTAGIAHEINNPINYISASNQALSPLLEELLALVDKSSRTNSLGSPLENNISQEEVDEVASSVKFLVDNINTGINRTTEIIGSLMTYSRTGELVYSECDLIDAVKNTLLLLHSKYVNRIVIVEKYDDVPLFKCSKSSINQAIMNLLVNAIDSIEGKGTIQIAISAAEGNEIVLSVKDSGIGIPSDKIDKIFDPFFTTKEVGKGTGLGLYLTYNIIHQHGGRIEVHSEVGEGTVFIVFLPLSIS